MSWLDIERFDKTDRFWSLTVEYTDGRMHPSELRVSDGPNRPYRTYNPYAFPGITEWLVDEAYEEVKDSAPCVESDLRQEQYRDYKAGEV